MSKRLSDELKDVLVSDYLSGVSSREIIKKHKTYELYRILNERGIEYKQNNDNQKERQRLVVELYLNDVKIEEIIEKTGYKDIYKILKKFNINTTREPKDYNTNKKEERNLQLIEDYKSGKYSIERIKIKYNMTSNNIYRILSLYNIPKKIRKNHHWVINQKVKNNPNMRCKFYILENYFGHTKIGITTKNSVRKRYRKNIELVYEIESTLKHCYCLESELKKELKIYRPKNIDKKIDGWSECYTLSPEEIISKIYTINV
jgi:hypothetical protein